MSLKPKSRKNKTTKKKSNRKHATKEVVMESTSRTVDIVKENGTWYHKHGHTQGGALFPMTRRVEPTGKKRNGKPIYRYID